MWRFATVLLALTTATVVAALPEGHPPIDKHHQALPDGDPPVAGYGHGLPPGHPVCPAGRQLLEPGIEGPGSADGETPQVISI